MPITVQVVAPAQPRWRGLHRTLQRRRGLRIVGHLVTGRAAVEMTAALTPDLLLIAADDATEATSALAALVRDLHAASPTSHLLVLDAAPSRESSMRPALGVDGVAGYLLWDDLQAGTLDRCLTLLARDSLLVASPRALDLGIALGERRQRPRIDGLVLSKTERAGLPESAAPERAAPQATVWEENPDVSALMQTMGTLAGMSVSIVTSAEALLAAASQARPGDVLVVDCSLALADDMARCLGVVAQTTVPVYIVHPRPDIIDAVRELARGDVVYLAPHEAGLALVEQLRLLHAQSATTGPALSAREHEVWRLLARRSSYAQIATELGVSASTIKTIVRRIKDKLSLRSRRDLISAYERLSTG